MCQEWRPRCSAGSSQTTVGIGRLSGGCQSSFIITEVIIYSAHSKIVVYSCLLYERIVLLSCMQTFSVRMRDKVACRLQCAAEQDKDDGRRHTVPTLISACDRRIVQVRDRDGVRSSRRLAVSATVKSATNQLDDTSRSTQRQLISCIS